MNRLLETIVFMRGDAADEAFKILYPDQDGVSIGRTTAESINAAMEHLAQWDYGEPTGDGPRETDVNPYNCSETEHYVMHWDYGYGWIALERKPETTED